MVAGHLQKKVRFHRCIGDRAQACVPRRGGSANSADHGFPFAPLAEASRGRGTALEVV
jgi:hypothetical protein